ncbi:MAG TPA: MFS transporter [Marinobacter hydrocarbonoclasticus]|uniref:MFS transporter n=1 Tax=Marinobacter TaxID=2742 RepID=UPI000C8A6579|nr:MULTISPECIES: MFS transporter [unclassified Marinobacter]MAC21426.1 MFS transporter [Marinobacter sp.]HCR44872.1 MFS transporter [Marinobacter nauticus]|tara:strand:- start:1505 stop:2812 length:1308 start_codon:yes stop_codon:yes gene_type:complete
MPPSPLQSSLPGAPENKRALWSWALYDWANSAFFTIILTFVFAQYFSVSVIQDEVAGTRAWGNIVGIAGVVIAILAPILGAIADQSGRRKPWLISFTLLCVVSSAMLWTVTPDQSQFWTAALWVGLGTLGAEFAFIFYNSMLPDLARPERTGRWSGWAWGLGYVGGIASLVVALYGFIEADGTFFNLDRDAAEHVRATFVLVAVWYLVFALPAFFFIPDRPSTGLSLGAATRAGLVQLKESIAHVRQYRDIVRFLVARMLYTDGLATIFTFGGVYAAGTFNMSPTEVLQFAIALNVTAGLGALGFAWIDDALGGRNTILLSLVGLGCSAFAILVVDGATAFWIWGMILGIFVGPLQSASRSHLARVAPPHLQTQMFGLFAFSGKATAFAGPLLVGWVTSVTDSQRWGMSTILLFLLIGFVLMLKVPATEARKAED